MQTKCKKANNTHLYYWASWTKKSEVVKKKKEKKMLQKNRCICIGHNIREFKSIQALSNLSQGTD